jgi:branched-chain amino acid transport system substrate-binding protein
VALITAKIPAQDLLTPMAAGADAAAKMINAQGGFGGRPLVIVTCNSMLEPAAASACAHETVADNPVAMVGCENNWVAAGLPIYAKAQIPSFNCLNSTEEVHNPWNFGIGPAAVGAYGAASRYACSLPEVKNVTMMLFDAPFARFLYNTAVSPIVKACGKTSNVVYVPVSAVDMTPYVQKAMQAKPDFVIVAVLTTTIVQTYKAFEQQGLPASRIAAADTVFAHNLISQAGGALTGGIALAQFAPWGLTSDPEVAAYQEAMQGSPVDPHDPTVEWGYQYIMWLYTVAKQVGFNNFNSATLTDFMRTHAGVHIPLSRSLVNPGPSSAPQIKQPYAQIVQWTGTTFKVLPAGPNKDGWEFGY